MNKKLLFFDVDGTLIESEKGINTISKATTDTLQQLQDKGHSVFLATGRCMCFIVDGVSQYPFSGYVTCNGAYVEYLGKEIFKAMISKEAMQAVKAFCEQRNMVYYLESRDQIYTLDKNHPKHLKFKKDWEMKDEVVVDQFDVNTIETYIGMIVVNSADDILPMKEALSPYFTIEQHRTADSFDLTVKGISKAVGIKELVKRLNKNINDTVAFGDGLNDIEMLRTVGVGVAMGNAVEEAKVVSDYITTSIDREGISKAVKYYNWI